ncbi:MAG: FAD-binding oxidoreductase [Bacteroidota bacterium]
MSTLTATCDYQPVTPAILEELVQIVGAEHVYTDGESLDDYSHDWTEDLRYLPEVVVKPADSEQIAALLKLCNRTHIPATPVGARTGLSGGALPVHGGIVIAMERLNRILELDTRSLQVTVQPGVTTQEIQDAAEAHGLMYPPDPSSKGSCQIGGNLAYNAGGAHAVKYGITKDYVLGLEVVTPQGEIIRTGAKVLKDATGYNLTQLMVGSEGTLGIITEATLKLLPKPSEDATMLIPFADAEQACEAVSAIFRAGITPSAMEFMEKAAVERAQAYLDVNFYELEGVAGHLIVEIDGNDLEVIMQACEKVAEVVENYGAGEIYFAEDDNKKDQLWRLRRCIGEATKGGTIYKEEDTVVPRAELGALLKFVKEVGDRYGFESICYGHAGDGNLHVNILKNDLSDDFWENTLPDAIREIFQFVKSKGGTISGEHGIGWVQKRYLDIVFSDVEMELQRQIKRVFDPHNILNPGKILP